MNNDLAKAGLTIPVRITGARLCRAARYRISAAPIVTRVYWRRLCQYIGAGSATVSTCFASSAISITGEMRDYRSVAGSGNVMHRRFCPLGGAHLFSDAEARARMSFVRSGTEICNCYREEALRRAANLRQSRPNEDHLNLASCGTGSQYGTMSGRSARERCGRAR